jgi:predicted Zn-dependent protease
VLIACWLLGLGAVSGAQRSRAAGVLIVPMGDAPIAIIDQLCRAYATRWRIRVERGPSTPIDESLVDRSRGQVVAGRALDWLEQRFRREAATRVVIGVTDRDQYIAGRSWRFAFSLRRARTGGHGLAVVSVARMRPEFYEFPPDEPLLTRRLGTMLTKNIGVLYFGKSLSEDPTSVMYENVLSIDDLDRMNDDFERP